MTRLPDPKAYYDLNYRPLLPADRNAPILDIGCGEGDFVRYAHSLGHSNITAVDRDEQSLAELRQMPGVTVICAALDAEKLKALSGGPWALIVAKQMIYYFDRRDAPEIVRTLGDMLTSDGKLAVEVFNGALLSSRFTEFKDPGILTGYTESGLRRLLEWNGLSVDEVRAVKIAAGGIKRAAYSAIQRLWFNLYRAVLIIERGRDGELPTIAGKSIIAVARRP